MEKTDVLIDEIRQITAQYRLEFGSRRKPWPESIRRRVRELYSSGVSLKRIAEGTEVPYHTVIQWKKDRRQDNFHAMTVTNSRPVGRPRKSVTVTVPTLGSETPTCKTGSVESMTVTVITPDGYQVSLIGLSMTVDLLSQLRGGR